MIDSAQEIVSSNKQLMTERKLKLGKFDAPGQYRDLKKMVNDVVKNLSE
jgi:hypothetical protein